MNSIAGGEHRRATDILVEFVVRTAEIIVLVTAFGIAAQRSSSVVLWCIFATLGIMLFVHTYASGMRWLVRVGDSLEADKAGCLTHIFLMGLMLCITGVALVGTFSAVSALMFAEVPAPSCATAHSGQHSAPEGARR